MDAEENEILLLWRNMQFACKGCFEVVDGEARVSCNSEGLRAVAVSHDNLKGVQLNLKKHGRTIPNPFEGHFESVHTDH